MIPPILLEAQTDEEFVERSTEALAEVIQRAIADRGECVIGLSGGSTPKPMYALLGTRTDINWTKVWIFLVDERHIAASENDSNTKLVTDTLIGPAGIPDDHFIRPNADLPIADCIAEYDKALQSLFADHGTPDAVTLGLGEDGHIASLFPPLADEAFGPTTAIHTTTDRFAVHDRISVTLPLLRNTPEAFVFLKGEAKKKVWDSMMASTEGPSRWPMKYVMAFGRTTVITLA